MQFHQGGMYPPGATGAHFSHTQLERPQTIPNVIPVGPFPLPTNHPLSQPLYDMRVEIAKLAVVEALQKATNNQLRVYMWNQLSCNNFNNHDVTKLTKLIIDKVLLDTYSYGTNIDMTRLIDYIRNAAVIGCELWAAKNAIEANPALITPETQQSIAQLFQMLQVLRNNVTGLYQQLGQRQTSVPTTMVGLAGMTGVGGGGGMYPDTGITGGGMNLGYGAPAILPSEAALTNVSGLALDNQSIFSGVGYDAPTGVTNLHDNFGVIEDMDTIITHSVPEDYISNHLPLATRSQDASAEPVVYQIPSGGTATLVSDNLSDVYKLAKRFKPTQEAQFCLTAFHPSWEKPAIFRIEDGSCQIANIIKGENEVDRTRHAAGANGGMLPGYQIPTAIFTSAFETVLSDRVTDSAEGDTPVQPKVPRSQNLLIHADPRWEDSLDAAINATRAELLVVPDKFAIKQHVAIGRAYFMLPEAKKLLADAIETGDISKIVVAIGEILKLTEVLDTDTMKERGAKDATFHAINKLETDLTEAVSRAMYYNLGIAPEQLRISSIYSDYEDLLGAIGEDFGSVFVETLLGHQTEIITSSIGLMSDEGILDQSRIRADFEGVLPNTVVHTGSAAIVTVTMATADGLDLSTIDDLPAVVPDDETGILTFIKNVSENENDLVARVFLATIDDHVYEIHRPWLISKSMNSYIIRKVK